MATSAKRALQERKVEVEKDRLLKTLKSNLTQHKADYQESVEGYQAKMLEEIEKAQQSAVSKIEANIKKARERARSFDPKDPSKFNGYFSIVEQQTINLPVPKDYSDYYEKAIQIVEWEHNPTLTLEYSEFVCFVLDEWDWKEDFANTQALYSNKM